VYDQRKKTAHYTSHINGKNYLSQNVRGQKEAGNRPRFEATQEKRPNGHKEFRMEQETDKRENVAQCQQATYYNKHDIKILNQSLTLSEVLQ
jgi:hypothetical protein